MVGEAGVTTREATMAGLEPGAITRFVSQPLLSAVTRYRWWVCDALNAICDWPSPFTAITGLVPGVSSRPLPAV
jgi:hypothetical protein